MNHITHARVMTRDGFHPSDVAAILETRHQESERQRMLAAVARIEARLELERALKRSNAPMATATRITRQPGAMATRNPGRIHPAPLRDTDNAAGFDRTDRILGGVIHALMIVAIAMTAAVLLGGAA